MKQRVFFLSAILLLAAGAVFLSIHAGSGAHAGAGQSAKSSASSEGVALEDVPLQTFQVQLLDLAFDTATLLPAFPHIKSRSRSQENVVVACFDLDQPQRALRHIEEIDNWRRGAGYADLAFYCVKHGQTDGLQRYLDLALEIAHQPVGEDSVESDQEWRTDRIKVKVARVLAWLGQEKEADRLGESVGEAESGQLEVTRTQLAGADFIERMGTLDRMIETGDLDRVQCALEAGVQLFGRFYEDEDKRALVEAKIRAPAGKLPTSIRVDLLAGMAGCALEHGDRARALELVEEAQLAVGSSCQNIPLASRLATLRYRAGDEKNARADADTALAKFEAERGNVMDLERAALLRPLAETYNSMGHAAVALEVYRKAVEEGALNVNARPRAEDLSATASSMAVSGVEPDSDLWARLFEIHDGLKEPW